MKVIHISNNTFEQLKHVPVGTKYLGFRNLQEKLRKTTIVISFCKKHLPTSNKFIDSTLVYYSTYFVCCSQAT